MIFLYNQARDEKCENGKESERARGKLQVCACMRLCRCADTRACAHVRVRVRGAYVRGAWCVVRGAWCVVHTCVVRGAYVRGAWCVAVRERAGTHARK